MSNILLYTNDLELGTTLSERLLHGNNTIMFVEQLHDLNNDSNLLLKQTENSLLGRENINVVNFFNCENPKDAIAEFFYIIAKIIFAIGIHEFCSGFHENSSLL